MLSPIPPLDSGWGYPRPSPPPGVSKVIVLNSGALSLLLGVNWLTAFGLKERSGQASAPYPTALLNTSGSISTHSRALSSPSMLGCLLTGVAHLCLENLFLCVSWLHTTCGLDYLVKFSAIWRVVRTPSPMRPEPCLGGRNHISNLFFPGYSLSIVGNSLEFFPSYSYFYYDF